MKTKEARLQEFMAIKTQLDALALPYDLPAIEELFVHLRAFVNHGVASSGTIPFPQVKRKIVYKLTMSPHIPSTVLLRSYV